MPKTFPFPTKEILTLIVIWARPVASQKTQRDRAIRCNLFQRKRISTTIPRAKQKSSYNMLINQTILPFCHDFCQAKIHAKTSIHPLQLLQLFNFSEVILHHSIKQSILLKFHPFKQDLVRSHSSKYHKF